MPIIHENHICQKAAGGLSGAHILFPNFVPDLVAGLVVGFQPCEANKPASDKPESDQLVAERRRQTRG